MPDRSDRDIFVGLFLNLSRVRTQAAYSVMLGTQAARARRLPLAWFESLAEHPSLAPHQMAEANEQRALAEAMARAMSRRAMP